MRGRARFVDDIHLPGMLEAAFVRSPHAHALIRGIDARAALAVAGVHAVLTLDDLRPHLRLERLSVGLPSPAYRQTRDRPALAGAETVHVGEPVAIVVAESRYIAEDAAALVAVDYEPLPAVADCRAALDAAAPAVHRDAPHNLLASFAMGYGDVDAAFAAAPHRVARALWQHRGGGHSIEARGTLAHDDPRDRTLNLWSSTQTPHAAHRLLCDMLGLAEDRVRVRTPDVGGGFGPKLVFYPEDVAVALAAILLRRPVKWIEDRREHFVASVQERDQYWDLELAFDNDARILGVRGSLLHDHGAYTARGVNLPYESAQTVTLPYDVPAYRLEVKLALTNTVPVAPVRGAGQPQGVFAMERLMDAMARALGIDRAEVRRRNLIGPERMPCARPLKARGGLAVVLDSGDYPKCQAMALARAGWAGFPARQSAARATGRHLGIGVANFVKGTGRGPFESARVRIGASGIVQVASGAAAMGQGTRTMLARIVAAALGIEAEAVAVTLGDTGAIALGLGGFNSRQAVLAGSSAHVAALAVRAKALEVAAHLLEASSADLELAGGAVRVKGAPQMQVTLGTIARALGGSAGFVLPGGMPPGLEATEHVVIDAMAYANGTAVAEVEVDVETGKVALAGLVIAHDCGRILDPMIVDGQIVGGAAHGVGNALYEWMGFDAGGQPVTTTLAEYLLASAPDIPPIALLHHESPSPLNPLGVKGVGECGVLPVPAAIISAIEDALSPWGVEIAQAPIRPHEIAALLNRSRSR
ncbi:MAG TPA: xanthine dehydrogenase family protein molybdopterin-binding subunit [Stellaceae bacterium]|nr:xanthine dehydrogenase family protein molybdopterin-binding subunit [Stellaceae bacterium]